MLTQTQYQKLQSMGLKPAQMNQVIAAAGGVEQPKSLGGFVGNVAKSAVNTVGGIGSALLSPIQTAKNIGKTAIGAAQLLDPGEQGYEQYARNVSDFYKQRYGGLKNIGETLYNDPVGAALDVSAVLGGAGAVAKDAGTLGKSSGLTKLGQGLSTASKYADPFQVVGMGAGKVLGGAKSKLSQGLIGESESMLTRGMGSPERLGKVKNLAGIPISELYKKYDLYDRSPEAFQRGAGIAESGIKSGVKSAIESGKRPDIRKILKQFDVEIDRLSKEGVTSQKSALAAQELANRKTMFMRALSMENKTPFLEKVRQIKSDFQGDISPSTYGMPTQEIGRNLGTTTAYRALLGGLEETSPGIRQAGREQAALIKLKEMAQKAQNRGDVRQQFNFTKAAGAGLGGMLAGIPGAVAGYASEQLINSPQFLSASSKTLRGAGEALNKGSLPRNFSQAATNAYNFGKTTRLIPQYKEPEKPSVPYMPGAYMADKMVDKPTIAPSEPIVTKKLEVKMPKNVFSNKAPFGKSFRLGGK